MSQVYSCIVLDDEPKALSVMSALIGQIPRLILLKSFTDPNLALCEVEDLNPDVIFVDIEMPHKNGFEVVDQVRALGLDPTFVFTTGYNQYAIKAIKKEALDYLLKPISITDMLDVVTRIQHVKKENVMNMNKWINGRIRFNTLNGFYIVRIKDIVYVKADGNYSELYMQDGSSKLVTANLAKVEELINSQLFSRISRSLVINVSFITQIDRKAGKCRLKTGQLEISLPISKKRIKDLAGLFG